MTKISEILGDCRIINPFNVICTDNFDCKTLEGGKNLFFDNGHFSAYGALKVWPYIEGKLRKGIPVQ
ncbi:SGNH hydrolase domain-containing protein [Catenovulum adriaticum]|uniref:SGNH hydrolase domain-containing protein n=1 Tax=Catenovulum adriaticum TaxID=2984846 RepID=A0ABY7AR15_9ALTE|nr:SGNH hydrolase domain-containing protein [Catenovulum sp. TS8]WAJ70691.1 SGNH hydrolase domain-containing protein [Catenovulum sp. TS8]